VRRLKEGGTSQSKGEPPLLGVTVENPAISRGLRALPAETNVEGGTPRGNGEPPLLGTTLEIIERRTLISVEGCQYPGFGILYPYSW
jgi:hypothetical protein